MFVESLIKKFFQRCSVRAGFTLMHDAFVAFSVANDQLYVTLDQVFVCQVSIHCIDQQHNNILANATNAKQSESFLSHPYYTIWVLRRRTLRTQYLHLCVLVWKQCIILASYKGFCKSQSFWLYTLLVALTQSFFSGTFLLELSSS